MSTSSSKVQLRVRAPDPITEIFVVDSNFRRVAKAVGDLDIKLKPGIYKVRCRAGDAMHDQLIELSASDVSMTVEPEPVLFPCSAPIHNTSTYREAHANAAQELSRKITTSKGSGAEVLIFLRSAGDQGHEAKTAHRLELVTLGGQPICEWSLSHPDPTGAFGGGAIEVDPGVYRVRVESPPLGTYEMFLVACAGWQTQLFSRVADVGRPGRPVWSPRLRDAAMFMAPRGLGFSAGNPDARLAELARVGLEQGREVLNVTAFDAMVHGKLQNPLIGIYGAHLALLHRQYDAQWVAGICETLLGLVGSHPDLDALAFHPKLHHLLNRVRTFNAPPSLRSSWELVVNANRRRTSLVTNGSPTDEVADGLVFGGAWLMHRGSKRSHSSDPERVDRKTAVEWLNQMATRELAHDRDHLEAQFKDRRLSGLDQGLIRALDAFVNQPEMASKIRQGRSLERELARQLRVPIVSVARAASRLARQADWKV